MKIKEFIMELFYTNFDTPLGKMLALASETEVYLLKFCDDKNLEKDLKNFNYGQTKIDLEIFKNLEQQVNEYFLGKRKNFDIKLNLTGSEFQIITWQALKIINYGETTTYKALAKKINSEKAFRAVANANGRNKIAIIIPCHRVIASNQKLSGYNAGIWRKQFLLNLEKNNSNKEEELF
ncbi:MAG: methylated-DNA--[protein]-cysteine S-methyltransferase [Bacteroidales bacterium]|nr:methylated-DNA--[protein]-cysteine S-methyltransferase [Bacteroidales bacterium]